MSTDVDGGNVSQEHFTDLACSADSGAQGERTRLPEMLALNEATPHAMSRNKTQATRHHSHRIGALIGDGPL